jgi:hypothetical protein
VVGIPVTMGKSTDSRRHINLKAGRLVFFDQLETTPLPPTAVDMAFGLPFQVCGPLDVRNRATIDPSAGAGGNTPYRHNSGTLYGIPHLYRTEFCYTLPLGQ